MARESFERPRKPDAEKRKRGITRRKVVISAPEALATGLALGTTGTLAGVHLHKEGYFDTPSETVAEALPSNGERYERAKNAYRMLYGSMKMNEVLFLDEHSNPIGEPKEAQLIQEKNGSFKIDQAWLDREREKICHGNHSASCNPKEQLPRQINLLGHLQGEAKGATYMEIVRKYGHEQKVLPLPGESGPQKGEGLSRIGYVREHVADSMNIPEPELVSELSRLAPALIGQESGFHNQLTSSAGATRAAQFMPDTMKGLKVTAEDLTYLRNQVEVMGKEFTNKYRTLANSATMKLFEQDYFPGNHGAFVRDFLLPVLFTSYNAGQGRMLEVVLKFMEKYENIQAFEAKHGKLAVPPGRELALTMFSEIAADGSVDRFGKEASSYWISAEGLAEAMVAEGLYS